jgi:hypothetical protein
MATSTAATTTLTRSTSEKRSHKPAMVGLGICAAVLAVSGGIVIGQRLTAGPATIAPVAPGTAVSFPSDWQLYRAGERGDVPAADLPSDWTTYRSGEH